MKKRKIYTYNFPTGETVWSHYPLSVDERAKHFTDQVKKYYAIMLWKIEPNEQNQIIGLA